MAETTTTGTVRAPLLTRTRLRYVPGHDRILLDGANAKDLQVSLWLTRGLALNLFQQLRAGMEKTSATAGKTIVGWEQEALALEHAAILKTDAAKGPGKPWRGEGQPKLLTRIRVKPIDGKLRLGLFSAADAVAGMELAQAGLHKFSAMLALRIQQANWDKGFDLSWLGRPPAPQRPAAKPN